MRERSRGEHRERSEAMPERSLNPSRGSDESQRSAYLRHAHAQACVVGALAQRTGCSINEFDRRSHKETTVGKNDVLEDSGLNSETASAEDYPLTTSYRAT